MKIRKGPFAGKEIKLASTSRLEDIPDVVDEFMFEIFDFDAGEYLLTDEALLRDFAEFDSSDVSPIWQRVEAKYGIDQNSLPTDRIVDICIEIKRMRNPQ